MSPEKQSIPIVFRLRERGLRERLVRYLGHVSADVGYSIEANEVVRRALDEFLTRKGYAPVGKR